MPNKISVLDNVHLLGESQQAISSLATQPVSFPTDSPSTQAELISRTNNVPVILVSPSTKITASYLDACPSLKYVGLCGTSTTNLDLEALSDRAITFTNVIDYGDEPAAEFIFMQLTMLARGIGEYQWRDML